jgi:hypothetical protein
MRRALRRAWAALTSFLTAFPKRHPKLKAAITSLIIGLPAPVLGLAALRLESVRPFQEPLQRYLNARPELVLVLLAWPLLANFVVGVVGDYLKRAADESKAEQEQLLALIAALDDVEGKKMHRFGQFAAKATEHPELASDAFLRITQPGKQIERLVGALHNVLTLLTEDSSLELVLARMEDDLPVQWRCQMPNDVLLPDTLLGNGGKDTLFALAARTKKQQMIQDIEVHLTKRKTDLRYTALGDTDLDRGSILCKPIYSPHLKRVVYVLSIKSTNHKVINKAFGKRYQLVFDAFCTRILLEAHLETIRKLAGGTDEDD